MCSHSALSDPPKPGSQSWPNSSLQRPLSVVRKWNWDRLWSPVFLNQFLTGNDWQIKVGLLYCLTCKVRDPLWFHKQMHKRPSTLIHPHPHRTFCYRSRFLTPKPSEPHLYVRSMAPLAEKRIQRILMTTETTKCTVAETAKDKIQVVDDGLCN